MISEELRQKKIPKIIHLINMQNGKERQNFFF